MDKRSQVLQEHIIELIFPEGLGTEKSSLKRWQVSQETGGSCQVKERVERILLQL